MPTPSGQKSLMDAILAGEKTSFSVGNRESSFEKPVQSMVDGSYYTSRNKYEEHVKANGCEIVGNDVPTTPKKKDTRKYGEVAKDITKEIYDTVN